MWAQLVNIKRVGRYVVEDASYGRQ
jgi:hypothetical protein